MAKKEVLYSLSIKGIVSTFYFGADDIIKILKKYSL